jgi:hypothetical protein
MRTFVIRSIAPLPQALWKFLLNHLKPEAAPATK